MQSVSAGWTAQQEAGAERAPVAEVTADWHRTGSPETVRTGTVTVTRSVDLGLPTEVTLISGTATAVATVEIAGDPTDGAKGNPVTRHSPYRTDSDLHDVDPERVPVTIKMGFRVDGTPELKPLITGGIVSSLEPSQPDGTVQMEVLDAAQVFHAPVDLPLVIGADPADFLFQPGLNAQWIVEWIFNHFGFHAVPAPRGGAVLAATLHGSAWPQVGTLTFAAAGDEDPPIRVPYAQGKFGLAVTAPPGTDTILEWTTDGSVSLEDGAAVFIEALVARPASGTTTSLDWTGPGSGVAARFLDFQVSGTTGIAKLVLQRGDGGTEIFLSGSDAVPDDGELHYVGVYVEFGATLASATFNMDGSTSVDSGDLDLATDIDLADATMQLSTPDTGLVEGLQVVTGVQATIDWQDAWTPTVVLESSTLELTAPPATHAEDGLDLLKAIASAEGALVFVDELRRATYWNRDHFLTAPNSTTVQAELVAANIVALRMQQLAYRVRNVISVPVTPLFVGGVTTLWQSTEDMVVPAGGTLSWRVDMGGDQAYQVSTDTHVIPSGGAEADGRSGYRAARNANGSGGEIANLVMTVTPSASAIDVSILNPNPAADAHLVTPSGAGYPSTSVAQGSVVIIGRRISSSVPALDSTTASVGTTGLVAVYRGEESIDLYGEVSLPIAASPWVQRLVDGQALAESIGHRTEFPTPQFGTVRIRARPELQIGDLVELTDGSGVTGLDHEPCLVMGMVPATGPSRATEQDLAVIPVARPSQLILDVTGRDELDDDNVL